MKKAIISSFLLVLACFFSVPKVTAQGFQLPAYETMTLKNGLTVYLMEQHEVPLIYTHMILPAGAVWDGENGGLASMTADALMFGTRDYSKAELEETVDFLGASFNTYAGKESAHLTASFGKKDQEKVLGILQQVVMYPRFDVEEFEKEKKRSLIALEQERESPRSVIDAYFHKFMYGDHPYGNPTTGTQSSLKKIDIEAIKSFHRLHYTARGSALAVVGDFDSKAMKAQLKKLLGKWKTMSPPRTAMPEPMKAQASSRVLLVNKEDSRETRFYIAGPGVARSNPDFVAIQVVNTVFGARFTSWLNDELRVNTGLTYGARSGFETFKDGGLFRISSFTKTSTTVEALDLALEVLNRLHEKGIDKETLESAKNYIKGGFPPQYETSGALAGFLADMYVYGIDASYINDFQKNVDSMTVDRAREIIAKYFPKDKLQFVLIGKASEIREQVKKYGALSEKEIKEDGF